MEPPWNTTEKIAVKFLNESRQNNAVCRMVLNGDTVINEVEKHPQASQILDTPAFYRDGNLNLMTCRVFLIINGLTETDRV